MRPAAAIVLAMASSPAVSLVAKVTVVMALSLAGIRLARTSRASVRHALLVAAFTVSLALPIGSMVTPVVPLVEVQDLASGRAKADAPGAAFPAPLASATSGASATDSGRTRQMPSLYLFTSVLLTIGWGVGTVCFLLPVAAGLWGVRRLRRSARPWIPGQSVAQRLASDAGIERRVEVLLHEAATGPASCGVARPMIVLPVDAPAWHGDDLNRALVHELEHVRRGDWASQCFARVVCACYWFHPLVWVARRRLILEAERACDDAVLQNADATAYASQLVTLAGRMSTAPTQPLPGMAHSTDLALRVHAVLDARQRRGRVGGLRTALVCAASAFLLVFMSPMRIVTTAQEPAATTQVFSGSLTDPLGRPLPDTRVTLWSVVTRQPVEAQSDPRGRFTFSGMPDGEYRLQVHGFGFQGRVTLARGEHLNRNVGAVMAGSEQTLTISSRETPVALPALPIPQPSTPPRPYAAQAGLDRCAGASMFCRVTPPVQIARAQPIYPATQRDNRMAGTVTVEGLIGLDGLLNNLHAIAPADPDFAAATLDALRRWQFIAMQLDGIPVEATIRVTANFVVP